MFFFLFGFLLCLSFSRWQVLGTRIYTAVLHLLVTKKEEKKDWGSSKPPLLSTLCWCRHIPYLAIHKTDMIWRLQRGDEELRKAWHLEDESWWWEYCNGSISRKPYSPKIFIMQKHGVLMTRMNTPSLLFHGRLRSRRKIKFKRPTYTNARILT